MAAVEAALAVCERIGGGTHFTEVRIGTDVQFTDQLQIVVQYLVERTVFLLRLGVDHRQMQRYCADIPAADEHRPVLLVRRLHAAAFKPRRQERAAAHRTDDRAVFFVHGGHVAFAGQRQPVRVHRACRAFDAGLKDVFEFAAGAVQVLVVQKYDLREQNRLFVALLTLTLAADVEHGDGSKLRKAARAGAHRHGDKRIIAAAGCDRVEFVLPALEALLKLVQDIRHDGFFDRLRIKAERTVFFGQHFIAALGIRLEQQINARHSKAAVLLTCRRKHDIADDIERDIECFRLIVPQIAHLKAVLQHVLHIEQTAVHRVAARRHIMDIDIAVTAGLQLLGIHEELLIQLLVELIKDQTALCRDKRGIGI